MQVDPLYGVYWHVHNLPQSVFEPKVYPTCQCGRKFVPLKEDKTKCFFCIFTNKTYKPIHLSVIKCKDCGQQLDKSTNIKLCFGCKLKFNDRMAKAYHLKRANKQIHE